MSKKRRYLKQKPKPSPFANDTFGPIHFQKGRLEIVAGNRASKIFIRAMRLSNYNASNPKFKVLHTTINGNDSWDEIPSPDKTIK